MSESQIPMHSSAAGVPARDLVAPRDVSLPVDERVRAASLRSAWPRLVRALETVFSFPVMLATMLAGATAAAVRLFDVDPDLWWHVKVGEGILATHHFPTTDPYSFTVHGQPWLAYEWLGEIVLAGAQRIGGLRGLDALLIVLSAAVMLSIYALATIRTGNSKAGFAAAAILLVLARPSFSLRPQMFGYLFLVLTLIALELFRQGKRGALWCLPVLMLAWVNTHGSWVIGMGAIFVYWMSGIAEFRVGGIETERWSEGDRKRISFVFLLCLCTLPLTPYGARIAISPIEFAGSLPLNVTKILEWQPMAFNLAVGKAFLALLLGFIVAQVALRYTWTLAELALFLVGTVMACLHIRFLLVFVPFFTPILAVMIARWMKGYDPRKDRFALNAVLMAMVVVGVVRYFPSRDRLQKIVAEHWPVNAVEYLNTHEVPGPMYNSYGFGGYLVWARGPEHRVFIDGRGDVYEREGVFADYLHISRIEPGAMGVLRNYGIRSCLVDRQEALNTLLAASAGWKKVYVDDVAALYVRNGGS
jgi:hypothetical protein